MFLQINQDRISTFKEPWTKKMRDLPYAISRSPTSRRQCRTAFESTVVPRRNSNRLARSSVRPFCSSGPTSKGAIRRGCFHCRNRQRPRAAWGKQFTAVGRHRARSRETHREGTRPGKPARMDDRNRGILPWLWSG